MQIAVSKTHNKFTWSSSIEAETACSTEDGSGASYHHRNEGLDSKMC